MSVDYGKARGKDRMRLPEPTLSLCHWSSQLIDFPELLVPVSLRADRGCSNSCLDADPTFLECDF